MSENVPQCETMSHAPRPSRSAPAADFHSALLENVGSTVGKEIASEEGHWYLPDGTPFYTYVNKSGETKPVTLRQARPVNAYPSVTTILKVADKPAINNYFERHIFDALLRDSNGLLATLKRLAAMDSPDYGRKLIAGEVHDVATRAIRASEDEYYFMRIKVASREHRDAKSERGTALHAQIERFLRGDLIEDKSWLSHIANLVRTTTQYGINLRNGEAEHSFAHRIGFGGKVDYHEKESAREWIKGRPIPGNDGIVLDFKTKDTIEYGKRYAYDEHAMQLAAYREGLGMPYARCVNVFVGAEDCKILIHEWTPSDLKRGWKMFQLLLRYWKLKHNYYPKGNNA